MGVEVPGWAAARLSEARVARLGTVGPGAPHLVPCCFAVEGATAYSAVDDKPKRSSRLQRLVDVETRPLATLLVDHYDEDWTALWWVRVSGPARVIEEGPERDRAVELLRAKYTQYRHHALAGPILAVELRHWRTWSSRPA